MRKPRRQDQKPLVGPIKHQTPIAKTSTGHVYLMGACLEGTSDLGAGLKRGRPQFREITRDIGGGWRSREVAKALNQLRADGVCLTALGRNELHRRVDEKLRAEARRRGGDGQHVASRKVRTKEFRRQGL
jgi:hypothetical protein